MLRQAVFSDLKSSHPPLLAQAKEKKLYFSPSSWSACPLERRQAVLQGSVAVLWFSVPN